MSYFLINSVYRSNSNPVARWCRSPGFTIEEYADEAVADEIEQTERDNRVLIEKHFEFCAPNDANAGGFWGLIRAVIYALADAARAELADKLGGAGVCATIGREQGPGHRCRFSRAKLTRR
jgi:hypothetical protein